MKSKQAASVLVCVTGQRDCDRLILAGRRIAEGTGAALQVLCVQPTAKGFCAQGEEIEYLHRTAHENGAEMSIYFHDDAALIAAGFVRQVGAQQIVTGMPDGRMNGFVEILHKLVPRVPISMVSKEGKVYHIYPSFGSMKAKTLSVVG